MNRFYVPKKDITASHIDVTDSSSVRHLKKVLRLRTGEEVFVSDGEGASYVARIESSSKKTLRLKISKANPPLDRQDRRVLITLACAVSRSVPFDAIVDKATQLEVDEIIPLFTERTLVKRDIFEKKAARLLRILDAGMKQSGALFIPHLRPATSYDDLIARVPAYDLCLLPNLSQKSSPIREAVKTFKGKRILILIGPEGDFTGPEIDTAFRAGCLGVGLGGSVLRVDTAAIAAVGYLKMHFGL